MTNKIVKIILLSIILNFCLSSAQDKKLLFIGIDGCRSDALTLAETPNIDELIDKGLYIKDALCSIKGHPTVSGPGWSTMLTGVWYDKHGVIDNSFNGSKINIVLLIF